MWIALVTAIVLPVLGGTLLLKMRLSSPSSDERGSRYLDL
jgi:hypothetical protein